MKKIFLGLSLLTPSVFSIAQQNAKALPADTATLRMMVESSPDSLNIQEQFISGYLEAMRQIIVHPTHEIYDSVLLLLAPQYQAWMNQFPHSAIVPYAIGDQYANAELPQAKPYLLKAVSLNPKLVKAWEDLWIDAERWGDFTGGQKYLLKAIQADPSNPEYAFYYANTFEGRDPAKYRKLSLELVNRFPRNERSAQALYWLAFHSTDLKDQIAIYERLKNQFPPDKFDWSASAMSDYFDLLLQVNPAGAIALAHFMTHLKLPDDDKKEWIKQKVLAEKITAARKFLLEHKAADAVKILAGVSVNWWSSAQEAVHLLKAEAMNAAGNTPAAYDSLLVFFSKTPGQKTKERLLKYGAKLGRDAGHVDQDVWQQRDAAAKPAPPFKLAAYLTDDSVSLSDYRGKVVLLTFWFPGCGPCRGEFPHFQKVLSKFKGKDIAYLGINVDAGQDEYVVPFMRSSGYGFTPLHENGNQQEKDYKVRGEPTNFLIDPQGRIIFTRFMIQDAGQEQMLKLMISSMLARRSPPPATPAAD